MIHVGSRVRLFDPRGDLKNLYNMHCKQGTIIEKSSLTFQRFNTYPNFVVRFDNGTCFALHPNWIRELQ